MKSLSFPNRPFPYAGRSAGNGAASLHASPPFSAFRHEMDQLLDDVFQGIGFTRGPHSQAVPTPQVEETDKDYLVTVDLPGVEMKDIDLSFREGLLTLKAERKIEGGAYSNRWNGAFERVIGIGQDVDENAIRATLKNGVLSVALPKLPERQPRRIEIQ